MSESTIDQNRLYYGDCLDILAPDPEDTIPVPDESVDVIYLDPPFNSNRDYSVLFKEPSGEGSAAQIEAFEDTWKWGDEAEWTLKHMHEYAPPDVADIVHNLVQALDYNDVSAYIVMLAPRLVQMHRVLKPTGTLWFHCDPTAGHYVKLLLDSIFGASNFVNEIVWKRTSAHSDVGQGAKHCGRIHDTIFLYAKKAKNQYWDVLYQAYDRDYIEAFYPYVEYSDGTLYRIKDSSKGLLKVVRGKETIEDPDFEQNGRRLQLDNLTAAKPGGDVEYEWKGVEPYRGRYWAYSKEKMKKFDEEGRLYYAKTGMPRYKRYLDEMPGVPLQDLWTDIRPVPKNEYLGYKTQKPKALLERIIQASCPEDGVILDPFCGCGTTICAAQELGRTWIGIDVTYLAIYVMANRLHDLFGKQVKYLEDGDPKDWAGAKALADRSKEQFEYWVCRKLGAHPLNDPKKSAKKRNEDGGVDGMIYMYETEGQKHPMKIAVQVKGGETLTPSMVRDFGSAIDNKGAVAGVFVSLHDVTDGMKKTASREGFWHEKVPKIQFLTVQDLLNGERPEVPVYLLRKTPNPAKKSRKSPVNPEWMFDD